MFSLQNKYHQYQILYHIDAMQSMTANIMLLDFYAYQIQIQICQKEKDKRYFGKICDISFLTVPPVLLEILVVVDVTFFSPNLVHDL